MGFDPKITSTVTLSSLSSDQYYKTNTEGKLEKIGGLGYLWERFKGAFLEAFGLGRSAVGMEAKEIALIKLIRR